jgi:nitroreductase
MAHFGEELKAQAGAAFDRMKQAALDAREISARAELMRHMLLAATAKKHLPREQAAKAVVAEWLDAWNNPADMTAVAPEMEVLSAAFYDYAQAPTDAHDRAVRDAFAKFKAAHDKGGPTVEDKMAWHSERALPWWGQIKPLPDGYVANPKADAAPALCAFWD